MIKVTVSMQVEVSDATEESGNVDWKAELSEATKALLKSAQEMGILDAFANVVRVVKADQLPNDMEGFFLNFLGRAQPRLIPASRLKMLRSRFKTRDLELRTDQGVGMIVTQNHIRMFLPQAVVIGRVMRTAGKNKIVQFANDHELQEWLDQYPPEAEHTVTFNPLQMARESSAWKARRRMLKRG